MDVFLFLKAKKAHSLNRTAVILHIYLGGAQHMKLIIGVAQVQSKKRITSCINEHNIYVLRVKQSKPSVVRDMKLQ